MPKYLALSAFFAALSIGACHQPRSVISRQISDAILDQAVSSNWHTVLEKPDWWVVIVAALTGVAIAWQALETRRATQAMQAGNRATASSQRARLKIHTTYDDHEHGHNADRTFQLIATNFGSSFAEVIAVDMKVAHYGPEIFKNLEAIAFPDPDSNQFSEPHFLPPGEHSQFAQIYSWQVIEQGTEAEIDEGTRIPVWYGWITFKDFVGNTHKAKFFYMFSGRNRQFFQVGPAGWNAED
jgi:hypothetical protein